MLFIQFHQKEIPYSISTINQPAEFPKQQLHIVNAQYTFVEWMNES